jgi:hypothetical protein
VDLGEDATIRIMLWTLFAYVAASAIGGVVVPDFKWEPPSVEETASRLQGLSGHPNVFGQQDGVFLILAVITWRKRLIRRVTFWGILLFGRHNDVGDRQQDDLYCRADRMGTSRGPQQPLRRCRHLFRRERARARSGFGRLRRTSKSKGPFFRAESDGTAREILTLTGRAEIWEVVWTKIKEKPLFGWGFNGTEELISSSFDPSFAGTPVNAHNAFLQTILSLGLLGSLPAYGSLFLLAGRFVARPNPVRDQIVAFVIVNGISEVEIFATPVLLTLVMFWVLAREAAKRLPAARTSIGPMIEGSVHLPAEPHNQEPRHL